MALTDPQKVTIKAVESTLPRVNTGNYASEYSKEDDTITLKLSTQESTRKRHMVRLDVSKIAENALTAQNEVVSMSAYVVIDRPLAGYTNEEALDVVVGLLSAGTASSNSLLKKLLGGES